MGILYIHTKVSNYTYILNLCRHTEKNIITVATTNKTSSSNSEWERKKCKGKVFLRPPKYITKTGIEKECRIKYEENVWHSSNCPHSINTNTYIHFPEFPHVYIDYIQSKMLDYFFIIHPIMLYIKKITNYFNTSYIKISKYILLNLIYTHTYLIFRNTYIYVSLRYTYISDDLIFSFYYGEIFSDFSFVQWLITSTISHRAVFFFYRHRTENLFDIYNLSDCH